MFLAVSKQKENAVKIGKVITKGQSHAAKYFLKFLSKISAVVLLIPLISKQGDSRTSSETLFTEIIE